MTPAEAAAARQEAEMLKTLGQDEPTLRAKAVAQAQAQPPGGDPRRKFIVGHEPQRRTLKQAGMDEWEIDCLIAEEIGEPLPPEPQWHIDARLAPPAPKPVLTTDGDPNDSPAARAALAQAQRRAGVEPTEDAAPAEGPASPLFAVEPVEMTDEEMLEASKRVRAAKGAVAAAETLLGEAEAALEAARAELAEAQRLVAAGAAWLTQ